jgi:hypothetical protein
MVVDGHTVSGVDVDRVGTAHELPHRGKVLEGCSSIARS